MLTAPPRTEGYEKLRLLAVLGHEHFAEGGSRLSQAISGSTGLVMDVIH